MARRRVKRLPPRGPANLAAKALGSRIFGLRVVTPKKGYTRKLKHKGTAPEASRLSRPSEETADE